MDEVTDNRVKLLQTFEADMKAFLASEKAFTETAIEMLDNQILLGDAIWTIYEHSAMKYYAKDLKAGLIQDILKIKDRIKS